MRIKENWKYRYRAVDKAGATVDFLLTAKRDRKPARRFLPNASGRHGIPAKITIDKSGANTAAIESYNADHDLKIETRQVKYLNNMVVAERPCHHKMLTTPTRGYTAHSEREREWEIGQWTT